MQSSAEGQDVLATGNKAALGSHTGASTKACGVMPGWGEGRAGRTPCWRAMVDRRAGRCLTREADGQKGGGDIAPDRAGGDGRARGHHTGQGKWTEGSGDTALDREGGQKGQGMTLERAGGRDAMLERAGGQRGLGTPHWTGQVDRRTGEHRAA